MAKLIPVGRQKRITLNLKVDFYGLATILTLSKILNHGATFLSMTEMTPQVDVLVNDTQNIQVVDQPAWEKGDDVHSHRALITDKQNSVQPYPESTPSINIQY